MQPEQPQQQGEEVTQETVQHFNKVCEQATQLMLSYKQQSQDLKKQISSMVTIYNHTADPSQAVPAQKIMEITNTYEHQMRSAHSQYQKLEEELKKEENQRNDMMLDIGECFAKLEKMEKLLVAKKQKQAQEQEKKKKQQAQ